MIIQFMFHAPFDLIVKGAEMVGQGPTGQGVFVASFCDSCKNFCILDSVTTRPELLSVKRSNYTSTSQTKDLDNRMQLIPRNGLRASLFGQPAMLPWIAGFAVPFAARFAAALKRRRRPTTGTRGCLAGHQL